MMEPLAITAPAPDDTEHKALLSPNTHANRRVEERKCFEVNSKKLKLGLVLLAVLVIAGVVVGVLQSDSSSSPSSVGTLSLDNFVFNASLNQQGIDVTWSFNGNEVYLRNDTALNGLSVDNGELYTIVYFDQLLNDTTHEPVAFTDMTVSPDGKWIILDSDHIKGWRHSFQAFYRVYNIVTKGGVSWLTTGGEEYLRNVVLTPVDSQGGLLASFVRTNNDIYIVNIATQQEWRVTHTGSLSILNGVASWEYEEEIFGGSVAMWWSLNATFLAYAEFNVSGVPNFTIPFYTDAPYTTNLELPYPCPSYPNSIVQLYTYHTPSQTNVALDMNVDGLHGYDRYVQAVVWASDSEVLVLTLNRPQNTSNLLLCDVGDVITKGGSVCVCDNILTTKTPYWIEPDIASSIHVISGSDSGGDNITWVQLEPLGNEGIVTASMYRRTRGNPTAVRLCSVDTSNTHSITALLAVSTDKIVFQAAYPTATDRTLFAAKITADGAGVCGVPYTIVPNPQPLHTPHSLRATTTATATTDARKWESASVNPQGTAAIMSYQSPLEPVFVAMIAITDTLPPWSPLVLMTNYALEHAVGQLAIPTLSYVTVPSAKDGVSLNGYMIKPRGFDASRRYPALIYVYGGPGSQTVTSTYPVSGTTMKFLLWLSSQGYVVVSVDGRGTGARGTSFMQQYTYKQLGVVEVEDQLATVKYLKSLSFIDKDRVGIWGWSYGGYMTTKTIATAANMVTSSSQLLSSCDTCIKAAVAVAPVSDWRFYDSVYTERYMDTPVNNPNGYNISSVLPQLATLTSLPTSFLLVHGTGDDNVHFLNSAEILKVLIQRQILLDVMVYPNQDHSISRDGAGQHVWRTIGNHLLKNL